MDNNLKCNATNCVHNMDELCSAREIEVQGGDTMGGKFTFCGTFTDRSIQNYAGAMTNVNISEGLKQLVSDDKMDPVVTCNAQNCIYNNEHYCYAENVQITNEIAATETQTECQTFYPK